MIITQVIEAGEITKGRCVNIMELKGGSGEKFILRGKVVEVEKTIMKREQSERMVAGLGGEQDRWDLKE